LNTKIYKHWNELKELIGFKKTKKQIFCEPTNKNVKFCEKSEVENSSLFEKGSENEMQSTLETLKLDEIRCLFCDEYCKHANFCGKCGNPLRCFGCKEELIDKQQNFCSHCGEKLKKK